MTKADIVRQIAFETGIEQNVVQTIVESFMNNVKDNMLKGESVYLRGFGSFILKERAEKTARNIKKNTTVLVKAHSIPAFKPAKEFHNQVKENTTK